MMDEIVMNKSALPEILLKLIRTEKVRVKEVDGEIRLTPVGQATKRPFSELRGLLKDKVWMSDDFDAPLDEMKDYME